MARDYHENLQSEDLRLATDPERKEAIEKALETIPDTQKLQDPDSSPLNSEIDLDDLLKALNDSKSGTAAGPDGIPYKVWKHLHSKYKTDADHKASRSQE